MPGYHQMAVAAADSSSSCVSLFAASPPGHRYLESKSLSSFQDSQRRMCCPLEILFALGGPEGSELESLQ